MQQVVQGQVGTLEQRQSGWVAVHINIPGRQFPLKLSTKREEIIDSARSLQGQMVDAAYNEMESENINPHNGQPYVNRYLEAIGPMGTQPAMVQGPQPMSELVPQAMPQQPVIQQPVIQNPPFQAMPSSMEVEAERQTRIMRQAATKVAAQLLVLRPAEEHNLASLIRISEQLLKYYREGVSWTTDPPTEYEPGSEDNNPDDIPF